MIFIPKKSGGDRASDWRPIALSSTIAKLFCGCIARRLSAWIEAFSILSPAQKGFLPYDGCFENNFVLSKRFQDARAKRQELCILSLDMSNAFGSITHPAIFEALKSAGAGTSFTRLIEALYCNASSCIITNEGTSEPLLINSGVRQGCPLSGLLFNITIDPLLRTLTA